MAAASCRVVLNVGRVLLKSEQALLSRVENALSIRDSVGVAGIVVVVESRWAKQW